MPCVKGSFVNGQALLRVVFFNPNEETDVKDVKNVKDAKNVSCLALLDTGATNSCISPKIAQAIDLRMDGEEPVSGVHGKQKTKIYTAGLFIPELGLAQQEISVFEARFTDVPIRRFWVWIF